MRRLLLALAFALAATAAAANGFVGAYIWGGAIDAHSGIQRFYDTVNSAAVNGFTAIRFKIGPSQSSDYNISPDSCSSNKTLGCYAGEMFNSPVWNNPGITTIIITALDFTAYIAEGGSNSGYFDTSTLSANQAAIEAEYVGLFNALKTRFGSRSIQFVLTNWEGDNLIYCGSAFNYASSATFAASCTHPNSETNAQAAAGLVTWFGYRDAAIATFLAANPGFNLIQAPEFNVYSMFNAGCHGYCTAATDTVLSQIGVAGGRAYCSYSSYDTQGGPGAAYLASIQGILTTCTHMMVGEAGYDLLTNSQATDIALFQGLAQVNAQAGVIGVIPWHYSDVASPPTEYGMVSHTGALQNVNLLGSLKPTRQTVPTAR